MKILCLALLPVFLTGCFIFNPVNPEDEGKDKQGDIFFGSGDVDAAVKLWQESLDEKKTAEVYEKIIMAYFIKNDLETALKWAEEAISFFPANQNLMFNYALIKYHKKDYESALEGFNRLLAVNSGYPNAYLLKGLIYEEMGKTEEAKREFVNEVNMNPGSKKAWSKIREEAKNVK